jgi:hypothetical protein
VIGFFFIQDDCALSVVGKYTQLLHGSETNPQGEAQLPCFNHDEDDDKINPVFSWWYRLIMPSGAPGG